MRLHLFLRDCGLSSRRKAEELIAAGRVIVDGEVISKMGFSIDPEQADVRVDGRRVSPEKLQLFRFYKPKGIITTLGTQEKRTSLTEVVRKLPVRVFPVGRLDRDVSGLLLLTNDGAFAQRMLHPRYEVPRVYWAVVSGDFSREAAKQAIKGVELKDGPGRARHIRPVREVRRAINIFGELPPNTSLVELEVAEGRKHFVKRLLAAVGHPVRELCRVRMGDYTLANLHPGEVKAARF